MHYLIYRDPEAKVLLQAHEIIRGRTHKRPITPNRSLKVYNHSPDGFEHGYGGSGPAQLALAILLDFTNDRTLSLELHQDFKWKVISRLDHPGGRISGEQIKNFIDEQQRKNKRTT